MMNVLFATNDVAYPGLELAIYTLLKHNQEVNIYIFTMECVIERQDGIGIHYMPLQDWQIKKLQAIVKYLGQGKSNLCIKDVHDLYMQYLDNSVNRETDFTPYTALRLLADLALPHVDHLWYFDCDIAITGNIENYYHSYILKDCAYGAYVTPDTEDCPGEMVAGVMFMNLKKMKETNFLKTARYNYNTYEYIFPDQCAIRDTGSPERFPPTLGYCEDLNDCITLPLIIHFTNHIVPKIYGSKSREYFFRTFPFLNYAKEGIALIDTFII